MSAPKISVCVVARNGARTYERLFSSLREFAERGGDMVLVDTGSTDDTGTIYKAFGFRVFEEGDRFQIVIPDDVREAINKEAVDEGEQPFIEVGDSLFNFAEARNYAAAQAKNDYIINPDADEELSVFDIDKVEEIFGRASRFRYDFVFSHNADGTPSVSFATDTRASDRRFWKWKGHVHETLQPIAPDPVMAYVPPSVFKVEHWQVPSPTRASYLAALAYACHLEPENDRNLHYYGRELMYRHIYKLAIKKLLHQQTISTYPMEGAQSILYVGNCWLGLKDEEKAIHYWHKAIELDPTRREGWLNLAHFYFTRNKPHQTLAHASAALALPRVEFYGNRDEMYGALPHHYLYWAYSRLGMQEAAQHHWMLALSYDPENKAFIYDARHFRRKTK